MAALAAHGEVLEGRWPLAEFSRLVEGPNQDGDVRWAARGQRRPVTGGEPETWLHLSAQTRIWRDCQRCLQPVALDLDVARALRFVADEATAAALDAETEDDVLALPRRLDLHALVEDELLLALPLVPMHVQCPVTLPALVPAARDTLQATASNKPFAVLAAVSKSKRGSGA